MVKTAVKGKLVNVSMYIAKTHRDAMDILLQYGIYASRCEFVRTAIREQLSRDFNNLEGTSETIAEPKDLTTIRVPNGDGTFHQYNLVRRLD